MVTTANIELWLEQLSVEYLKLIADNFKAQAEARFRGEQSTLHMYPSFLHKKDITPVSKPIVALDLGGSHIRVAAFNLAENGSLQILPGSEVMEASYPHLETEFAAYCEFIATFSK